MTTTPQDPSPEALELELERLRLALRATDEGILRLAIERFERVEELSKVKEALGRPVLDSVREESNKSANQVLTAGRLPPAFTDELSELLAKWARLTQAQRRK